MEEFRGYINKLSQILFCLKLVKDTSCLEQMRVVHQRQHNPKMKEATLNASFLFSTSNHSVILLLV